MMAFGDGHVETGEHDLEQQIGEMEGRIKHLIDIQKPQVQKTDKTKEKNSEKNKKNIEKQGKETIKDNLTDKAKQLLNNIKKLLQQGFASAKLNDLLGELGTIVTVLEQGSFDAQEVLNMMKRLYNNMKKQGEELIREKYNKDIENLKVNMTSDLGNLKNQLSEGSEEQSLQQELDEFEKMIAGLDSDNDGILEKDELQEALAGLDEHQQDHFKEALKEVIDLSKKEKLSQSQQHVVRRSLKDFQDISAKIAQHVDTGERSELGGKGFVLVTTSCACKIHEFIEHTWIGTFFKKSIVEEYT